MAQKRKVKMFPEKSRCSI